MPDLDEDALAAAADLVQRSGGTKFEIGYLHDDVPVEQAGWYAAAWYQGARLIEESVGPVEAAEALSRRLLAGAACGRCGRPVRLSGPGGTRACRWTRQGRSWEPGCGLPRQRRPA